METLPRAHDAHRTVSPRRPLLRYHGGKWLLAPWIISHFPPHRIYVEPFGGAASVLLRKPRAHSEIYNELNGEIVNLFRIVRERGNELARALELTPYSRAEYYAAMGSSNDELEAARRLVIRSLMGFGLASSLPGRRSGFRARSERRGTTPAHDFFRYPESLAATIERLRGVVIENRPARDVMSEFDGPDTLHYCDPPYVHETRMPKGHSVGCYYHEMTDADHEELAEFLHGLKGMVIISGYDCLLYERLYSGWQTSRRKTLADGARPRIETLWLSPKIDLRRLLPEEV